MKSKFRVNQHIAKEVTKFRVDRMIMSYPSQYSTPKYMTFMWKMLEAGWEVKIHTVKDSKYVFVEKGDLIFKIRFSSHKPSFRRQQKNDCDFYVGISHKQVFTTDEIIKKIKTIENGNKNRNDSSSNNEAGVGEG